VDTRRAAVPGWRAVHFSSATRRVTVPRGTLLDLGATAKAYAADTLAARLSAQLPGGFLVDLGGDVAVGGEGPVSGWQIGVEDAAQRVLQVVASTGQAIATSSTRHRRWASTGGERHHIIDPRTGLTATTTWAQVTCAAATAAEANALATAAVVLGRSAPAWLEAQGVPARLDALDGTTVTTPGWPAPDLADRNVS
jgi:thiamine biosynthesis lipoprotein